MFAVRIEGVYGQGGAALSMAAHPPQVVAGGHARRSLLEIVTGAG